MRFLAVLLAASSVFLTAWGTLPFFGAVEHPDGPIYAMGVMFSLLGLIGVVASAAIWTEA
jgi:hypothetical protein